MIDAAVLRAMQAAGASTDVIIAAVEAAALAAAAAEEARLAKKREGNLARQQRKRLRDRNAVSRDVTPVTRDTPPNDIYSNPPVSPVEDKSSTAPKGRSDRGSKIPEDWQAPTVAELSPEARALASCWPVAAYRAEAEAFRNYWLAETGAKARKSNWNRAWANRIVTVNSRVMRDAKFSPAKPGVTDETERILRKYSGQEVRAA